MAIARRAIYQMTCHYSYNAMRGLLLLLLGLSQRVTFKRIYNRQMYLSMNYIND